MADPHNRTSLLGNGYGWWLGGIAISLMGSSMFGFALGWTATAYGGGLAGVVSSVRLVPGLLLVLLGGAWSDRYGPWWVMVLSDAAMVGVGICTGVLIVAYGAPPWLLIGAAVSVGTVSSLYIPASAMVPRLLVPDHQLGRAMAARSVVGQLTSLMAPALGGLAVVVVGLAVLSWFDAITYAVILVVLLVSRRRLARGPELPPGGGGPGLLRSCWEGLALCLRDPVLRTLTMAVGVVAGILLPLLSVLVPLLARAHQWPAPTAGAIDGAEVLGSGLVGVAVLWRGLAPKSGVAIAVGLVITGFGCTGLALAPSSPLATAAGCLTGLGLGVFTSHVAPVILAGTATSHLARVQAFLLLVQMAPVLVTANVIGLAADRVGPSKVTMACGLAITVAGAGAYLNRGVRSLT